VRTELPICTSGNMPILAPLTDSTSGENGLGWSPTGW
jgi:hypothetical protein